MIVSVFNMGTQRKALKQVNLTRYLWLIILFLPIICLGQSKSDSTNVYRVNSPVELPVSIGAFVLAKTGFNKLRTVSSLEIHELEEYEYAQVNRLDRSLACLGNCQLDRSQQLSDLALNITLVAPAALLFDRAIRKQWLDFITLYVETEVINTGMYLGSAFSVRRARPLVYDQDLPMNLRAGNDRTNSFYSGHVGNACTATFFMAKVYTDYHKIKGWKRIGLFGLASLPPAYIGYHRLKAGKHFMTDVLIGYLAGGLIGIAVPEMHRNRQKSKSLAKANFWYGQKGAGMSLRVMLK